MADKLAGIIDWEAVSKFTNLKDVVRILPPEDVIDVLGIERTLEAIGLPRMIEAVGLPRVVEMAGPEKFLKEILKVMPADQVEEILRGQQGGDCGDKGGE